jgi:hypothetical protein
MCFSATASFTAGVSLSVIGGATLLSVRRKSDIPFAAIPLLFGIQQLMEGVIWISFDHSLVLSAATFIYLLFSHVVWPTLLPVSVYMMETSPWRRWALRIFIATGAVVSAYFLYYLLIERVTATVVHGSIAYISPHFFVTFILSPYSVATCASCLFSRHRFVNLFGIVAFLSAIVAYRFYEQTFVSVWCFFGALLSVIIFMHFRSEHKKT